MQGLNVLDISDIDNENISQYGYFDTFPNDNDAGFNGSWNVYPFFESRNIIISGEGGFTLVRDPSALNVAELNETNFAMYPNPTKGNLTIVSAKAPVKQVEIYSILGERILNYSFSEKNNKEKININSLQAGVYLVNINT